MSIGRRIRKHVRSRLCWRLSNNDVTGQMKLGRDAAIGRLDQLHMDVVALGQMANHEMPKERRRGPVELSRIGQARVRIHQVGFAHTDTLIDDRKRIAGRADPAVDLDLRRRWRKRRRVLEQLSKQVSDVRCDATLDRSFVDCAELDAGEVFDFAACGLEQLVHRHGLAKPPRRFFAGKDE